MLYLHTTSAIHFFLPELNTFVLFLVFTYVLNILNLIYKRNCYDLFVWFKHKFLKKLFFFRISYYYFIIIRFNDYQKRKLTQISGDVDQYFGH